jgi:DNA-binding GntR family transcriptional regulator
MSKHGKTDRVDVIYQALRTAILEQALEPDRKLPEDAIGEQFGASRTIVRYALNLLAAEGLVVQQRNRSATVAHPSWEDARDTFEIRVALERLVMARLAGQLTPAQTTALEDHIADEEKASNVDEVLSIRLAGEFHIKLAEMTESDVLIRSVREFASRCSLILSLYSRPHSSECAVEEHRQILEFLRKGKAEKAADAMAAHLRMVADRALVAPHRSRNQDIGDILAPYARADGAGGR